jgi:hypothetical protein
MEKNSNVAAPRDFDDPLCFAAFRISFPALRAECDTLGKNEEERTSCRKRFREMQKNAEKNGYQLTSMK